jgi:predicted SnoaL-like aldol condensation-catalyzing enzyme
MFNQCKPAEAVEQYVGGEYIQHNLGVGDGKQAFIDCFDRYAIVIYELIFTVEVCHCVLQCSSRRI